MALFNNQGAIKYSTQGGSPVQSKYRDLIDKQLNAVNDPGKAKAWSNEMRATVPATILGQGDLQAKLLQGPAPQMGAASVKSAQVNPDILKRRQSLLAGNRDAMSRQFVAQNQTQDDLLKRRFSQLGGGNSGALLKAQLQGQQELGSAQAAQERDLAGQELAAQSAFEEAQAGRDQATAALQAQLQQQANAANLDTQLKERLFNTELENKTQEYNQQAELQRVQQLYDIDTTEFNRGIAQLSVGGGK